MPWSDDIIPPEESIEREMDEIASEDGLFLPWPNWPGPPLVDPDDDDEEEEYSGEGDDFPDGGWF